MDFAKAKAANIIAIFAQDVQAWIAGEQGKLENIKVQIAQINGVVDYNKGLVTLFATDGEAYKTVIEGKAKRNEAITEIFKAAPAEIPGRIEKLQLSIKNFESEVKMLKQQLAIGNVAVCRQLGNAEVTADIQSYGTESALREKIAEVMANIAMQLAASFAGSLNVSAGLSHQTGRHQSESFGHTESRSVGFGINNSMNEGHDYKEK